VSVFLILFLRIAMASKFDLEHKRRRAETLRKDMDSQKTEGGVFNHQVLKSIGKLGSDGFIDQIKGPIATGKEADVFLGYRGKDKIVIKIFRLASASYFRNPTVLQYILGDERFKDIRRTPRALITSWTMKEFRNLKKVNEIKGVNSPKPLAINNNVIVMEHLGKDAPAPQLLKTSLEDPEKVYRTMIDQIKRMYRADFVHADLSEYNTLMVGEKPYLIDFGQGVLLTHPHAEEFLERDVRNICNYFKRYDIESDLEKILEKIKNG